MVKNQYVILTGTKNNAGDFLIKDRGMELFSWLRPDRSIIEKDGWKPFDEQSLAVVNNSRALILMGGPAIQKKMRPAVYGLVDNLDEIKVPIIAMGIGWYSLTGNWNDTHNYPLNNESLELLQRIDNSGYLSSVRDYHTLNLLKYYGMNNFLMTGCPALFSRNNYVSNFEIDSTIRKVGFSLGVSLKKSNRMFKQMQNIVTSLCDQMTNAKVIVAFHHGLGTNYLESDGASKSLYKTQRRFAKWLELVGVEYVDISNSSSLLKRFYSSCDLHIGYRVHAHIFMNSILKPSILINEDGRGRALVNVLGGVIFDGYEKVYNSTFVKIGRKLGFNFDCYKDKEHLVEDLSRTVKYELEAGVRFLQPGLFIKKHFLTMKLFLEQLP